MRFVVGKDQLNWICSHFRGVRFAQMHTDPNEKDVDGVSQWEKHSDESSMRKHQFVVVALGTKYQFSAKWSHSSKWETESVKIVAVKCPQSLFGEMEYEIRKNLYLNLNRTRHGGLDACAGGAASQVQAAGGRRLWSRGWRFCWP